MNDQNESRSYRASEVYATSIHVQLSLAEQAVSRGITLADQILHFLTGTDDDVSPTSAPPVELAGRVIHHAGYAQSLERKLATIIDQLGINDQAKEREEAKKSSGTYGSTSKEYAT